MMQHRATARVFRETLGDLDQQVADLGSEVEVLDKFVSQTISLEARGLGDWPGAVTRADQPPPQLATAAALSSPLQTTRQLWSRTSCGAIRW